MQAGKIKYFIAFFLLVFFVNASVKMHSNPDLTSFGIPKDSVKQQPARKWERPQKAAVMSACLPGLGQIYNRKYWKAPVIYGLLGTFTWFTIRNHKYYKDYSTALGNRYDTDTANDYYLQYSSEDLITLKRSSRRFRDLSILGGTLIYVLQIIDANVDGHLANFDVDNISIKMDPWLYNPGIGHRYNGFSLTLQFKNRKNGL